jgi:F-type H+-transporting ATPase subunit b
MHSRIASGLVLAGALAFAGAVRAQHEEPAPAAEHEQAPGGEVLGTGELQVSPHARPVHGAGHGAAEHGGHGGHDESAAPGEINWIYGLVSEQEGLEEPNLLFRPKGMPAPFLASIVNFAILVFLLVKFGAKPLANALTKRKDGIMRDIDDAARMRDAAETRLREYKERLEKIGHEIERVRADFREQGERDRERILREAEERRVLMRKDAEFLLAQELKQARIDLTREAVDAAVRTAADIVSKKLSAADHERFADAFVAELETAGAKAPKGIVS